MERVVYFCGGQANVLAAHKHWRAGSHDPTEVSVTFSSQIAEVCEQLGYPTYMVSPHPEVCVVQDGLFTIEHRPKPPASGWRYHLTELRYAWGLLRTARRFRATIALVDSGAAHLFLFGLFRAFGMRVVPILHNTLWPAGFYPERLTERAVLALDRALFWLRVPSMLISVSPECEAQVRELVPKLRYPALQVRAQFRPDYFRGIRPATFPTEGRFRVLFIGRVLRAKGVFDILDMAERANKLVPGRIQWIVCGRGADFAELQDDHARRGLSDSVELAGWVSLSQLKFIYDSVHAGIVPTRSGFAEGLAMTAVETILAGRPLISNPIVPATELLRAATMMARSNDAASHADAVIRLSEDPHLYGQLVTACGQLGSDFLDPAKGLGPAVRRALSS